MSGLPSELSEWLPQDVPERDVAAWALVARSFDRATGEVLVLRMLAGARRVMTRPERFELFRELPLDDADPPWLTGGESDAVLRVRIVDGRRLELPVMPAELPGLRGVLETNVIVPREPSPARKSAPAADRRAARRSPAPPPRSSNPPGHSSTLRPPESAEMEVVRIPRSMRVPRAAPVPSVTGAASSAKPAPRSPAPGAPSDDRSDLPEDRESVHPPQFTATPVPIVRGARDVDALRANLRHHWEQGSLDEAGQVARVLVHLGLADAMEERLSHQTPEIPPEFAEPLSEYLFKAWLAHDEEDPAVGAVLEALWPAILAMRARPERELGLRPRDEVDLDHPPLEFARLFAHAARALSIEPAPRLFVRTDVAGGMAHLVTQPLASLCGGTLATGFDGPSILHVLGHHLCFYRPHVYLLALVPAPVDSLALFLAGLHLEERLPPDPRLAVISNAIAKHMVPQVREALRHAAADFPRKGPEVRSEASEAFNRFRRAAYLTAVRTGYLLSGRLTTSERMQRMMPAHPGLTVDEVVDDLISFAVSPAWMALRKEIGVASEPSVPGMPLVE